MIKHVSSGALLVVLALPLLFLLSGLQFHQGLDWAEIWWAAKNSFFQAFFAATIIVIASLWGARGLLCFPLEHSKKIRTWLEVLLLLPNFLPSLFTLLAVLNLIDPFPFGTPGVIIVHFIMNIGLASVLVADLIEKKLGSIAEVASIEGWRPFQFWWRGAVPFLRYELFFLWIFLFGVCFSSFAIPLVVGGTRGTTLEVLVYEKIRLNANWSGAICISIIQLIVLFVMSLIQSKHRPIQGVSRKIPARYLKSNIGLAGILIVLLFWIWGYLSGVGMGWSQRDTLSELSQPLMSAFLGTFFVGVTTGIFSLLLLLCVLWIWPLPWFEKFLSGFTSPSQALVGFVYLIILPNDGWWPYFKIPFVLSLVYLTLLWRMGWSGQLNSLLKQRQAALVLGASESSIRWKIMWPQIQSKAGTLIGLAGVWACGDFALSRLLAYQDLTLAMIVETLMSGYRLGLASLLSLLVILVAFLVFFFLKGVTFVIGRKSYL